MADYDTVWVHTPSDAYRQLGRRRIPVELADRLVAAGLAQRPGGGVKLQRPQVRAPSVSLSERLREGEASSVEALADKAVKPKRTTRKRAKAASSE